MKQSPESIALTEQIIALRGSGLTWGQIAARVGRSRNICQQRYLAARAPSERARRKHAEALVETLQAQCSQLERQLGETQAARMVAEEERGAARDAIAREWLCVIETLIGQTQKDYDEAQDAGRDDLRFFYAGKRSVLDHFLELANGDARGEGRGDDA